MRRLKRAIWSAPAQRSVDGALDGVTALVFIQSGVSRYIGIATALQKRRRRFWIADPAMIQSAVALLMLVLRLFLDVRRRRLGRLGEITLTVAEPQVLSTEIGINDLDLRVTERAVADLVRR